jgi:hypothetical protein
MQHNTHQHNTAEQNTINATQYIEAKYTTTQQYNTYQHTRTEHNTMHFVLNQINIGCRFQEIVK